MRIKSGVRQFGWALLMSFTVVQGAQAARPAPRRYRMASTATPFTR